jgi:predicted cupin superfamily sugar epimerase
MTELPDWARQLDLSPHPEGGWFRETWRSELTFPQSALPSDYTGPRSAGTAILFLLMPGQQSAWHTVRSAELWMFHRGSPLLLEVGREQDSARTVTLGPDIGAGEQPQFVVAPRHWQRARPRPRASGATGSMDAEPTLVSCVVVPGFDFADFALSSG